MTSILIANNVATRTKYSAKSNDDKDININFLTGYFSEKEIENQNQSVMSSFFTSLITHEEIYLNSTTLALVLDSIGSESLLKLLDKKIIKTCFGLGNSIIIIGEEQNELSTAYHESSDINRFENYLAEKITSNNKDFKDIVQYVDNSSIILEKKVAGLGVKEVASDLSNSKTKLELGLNSESINEIETIDVLKTLRLADVAQSLVIQSELKIDSLLQDGYANTYINTKLGALTPLVGNDPIQVFTNIMDNKGIPDLYHLYKKGTIDIDDILKCRNSFNGGVFRNWFASEDYDEKAILKALLNKGHQSHITKLVRYIYPNVFGLVSPLAGAASSAFDSYIMNRVIEGWTPSLFLDDVLKKNIDNKIGLYEQRKKRDKFIERYGSIDRNEKCPCQSGNKYKKCHGR